MKRQSGIDTKRGDRCSRIAFEWAKKSFQNRRGRSGTPSFGVDGSFANILLCGDQSIGISSDGVGTKIELAERMKRYNTLGFDLLAMILDDLVAVGLDPVAVSNILDVDFLDESIVDQLMKGLHDAAREAEVVITGGEIAELGSRIGGYGTDMHFNWCATGFGILPPGREPLDGKRIRPGDFIIAIGSDGFRSNGFSKIRSIMESTFGPVWHEAPYDDLRSWGSILLTPSRIYARIVSDIVEDGCILSGIAHITGGGIGDNLRRVLAPEAFGAVLGDILTPHDFMVTLQRLGDVPETDAYRWWNMGCGMLIVAPAGEVTGLVHAFEENGLRAREAGRIQSNPFMEIETRGADPTRLIIPVIT